MHSTQETDFKSIVHLRNKTSRKSHTCIYFLCDDKSCGLLHIDFDSLKLESGLSKFLGKDSIVHGNVERRGTET